MTSSRAGCGYIHNLEKLIALCEKLDPAFGTLSPLGQELTPYAVELRYDDEFWPSPEAAARALNIAEQLIRFVADRLP